MKFASQSVARSAIVVACIALMGGCVSSPRDPLPLAKVDLSKVYGGWYIIATIPNWFERGAVQPYDVYSAGGDGDLREDFYVRFGGFGAPCKHYTVLDKIIPGSGNAVWRVQPFWPVRLPFLVGYVDPDYRFIIFGEDNRKLGWIYARQPVIDDSDYAALEHHLQELGYDPALFKRFLHLPSQFNQPGYWIDGVKPTGASNLRCGMASSVPAN